MAEDWIFESVIGYLLSPVWQVPISSFIEERCVVFDPEEDNPKAYKQLYVDYKHMVDFLLESFLEDLGLEADAFIKACQVSRKNLSEHVLNAFEEVEASHDYEIFKRMMIQKNIELELQALRMIQQRNGVIPDAMSPSTPPKKAYSAAEEEKILQEVLMRSKEEFEKGPVTGVNKEMEKALANSQQETKRLEKEQQKEKEMLDKALKLSLETPSGGTTASQPKEAPSTGHSKKDDKGAKARSKGKGDDAMPPPPPLRPKASSVSTVAKEALQQKKMPPQPQPQPSKQKDISNADAAAQWMQSAKDEAQGGSSNAGPKVAMKDDEELRKREAYLKQQRDKLLAMKKQARQKSLDTYTSSSKEARKRPVSARAAQQATSGKIKAQAESSEEDKQKMAMRMALANRLKKEVINKKE